MNLKKPLYGVGTGVMLGSVAFVLAFIYLPTIPVGEWAWLARSFVSFIVGGIVFAVVWFLTVMSVMAEVMK